MINQEGCDGYDELSIHEKGYVHILCGDTKKSGGIMAAYKNTAVHYIFGTLGILIIILAGVLMELSSVATGAIFGVAALISAPLVYMLIKKVPKHDDDIHAHENDERKPIRGKKTIEA